MAAPSITPLINLECVCNVVAWDLECQRIAVLTIRLARFCFRIIDNLASWMNRLPKRIRVLSAVFANIERDLERIDKSAIIMATASPENSCSPIELTTNHFRLCSGYGRRKGTGLSSL